MRDPDPWAEANARTNITILIRPLPDETGGAVAQVRKGHWWIIIDPLLSPVEQRCRLAHEICHIDWGSSARCRWSPGAWDVVVAREEMHIDRQVAEWLVPFDRLVLILNQMLRAGTEVTASAIGEEFKVTKYVARAALDTYRLRLTVRDVLIA